MARPRPVPPVVRARAASARQNRSKTFCSSPGRSPTPKSRTETATASLSMAVVTTTSLPSPCSTAFTKMLRRMRSTRRRSTSAKQPLAGSRNSIRLPRRSASCWASSADPRTRSHTSTRSASKVAAPASYLLISSRSTSSDSNRSSWLCSSSADRAAAWSRSSRDSNSRSAAILMVASGVRSSCDTSETNCRCTLDSSSSSRSWRCRLAAISLNEVASAARSSTPSTRMRSVQVPGGQPLGGLGGVPDRQHHPPGDQRRDRGQQHGQGEPDAAPGSAASAAGSSAARSTGTRSRAGSTARPGPRRPGPARPPARCCR